MVIASSSLREVRYSVRTNLQEIDTERYEVMPRWAKEMNAAV